MSDRARDGSNRGESPVTLGVMLSGSGRTLLNLAEHIGAGDLRARIGVVIASRECLGAERARGLGLKTLVLPGDIPADRLEELRAEHRLDWLALAGYLRRLAIPPSVCGRVVNMHPALLPSFGGAGMYGHHVHEAVLAAGCKVSGCTVHLCDEVYDRGPILIQKTCPVSEDDDADSLAARVFELEKAAYPEALELLISGRVKVEGRRAIILPAGAPAARGAGKAGR